jgi:hypothetical protein
MNKLAKNLTVFSDGISKESGLGLKQEEKGALAG